MESKVEAKDSVGPVVEDLARGAKRLRHAEAPQPTFEEKASEEELEPYRNLFEKHRGDVRAIFSELGEDPGKALKYPPRDCEQFATEYVRGGYTYVPDAKASRK